MAEKKIPRPRGSDFLMRFSQGRWSEDRIIEAINSQTKYAAIRYGLSMVGPTDPARWKEHWLQYQDFTAYGKRPDLLLFKKAVARRVLRDPTTGKPIEDLLTVPDNLVGEIIANAVAGLECENSLWIVRKMPAFEKPRTLRGGKTGFRKTDIIPTVIVKREDVASLEKWTSRYKKPIYVVQVFYDRAYMAEFGEILRHDKRGTARIVAQKFSNRGGGVTIKETINLPYTYATQFGHSEEEPALVPEVIKEDNGHLLPYVRFEGGRLKIHEDAIKEWDQKDP